MEGFNIAVFIKAQKGAQSVHKVMSVFRIAEGAGRRNRREKTTLGGKRTCRCMLTGDLPRKVVFYSSEVFKSVAQQ